MRVKPVPNQRQKRLLCLKRLVRQHHSSLRHRNHLYRQLRLWLRRPVHRRKLVRARTLLQHAQKPQLCREFAHRKLHLQKDKHNVSVRPTLRVNKNLLQVRPLFEPLAYELDLRTQVELFLLKRQKHVLKFTWTRRYWLRKRSQPCPKRLKPRKKKSLLASSTKELLKNHRRDVPRQREPLHLPQRHKQPLVNLKLHRTCNVHRKVHLVAQRLTARTKPKPVKLSDLLQKKKELLRVWRRRRRRPPKLLLPYWLK